MEITGDTIGREEAGKLKDRAWQYRNLSILNTLQHIHIKNTLHRFREDTVEMKISKNDPVT